MKEDWAASRLYYLVGTVCTYSAPLPRHRAQHARALGRCVDLYLHHHHHCHHETRRAKDGPGAQGRTERGAVPATATADDRERGLGQVRFGVLMQLVRAFGVLQQGSGDGASKKRRNFMTDADADACVLFCRICARLARELNESGWIDRFKDRSKGPFRVRVFLPAQRLLSSVWWCLLTFYWV